MGERDSYYPDLPNLQIPTRMHWLFSSWLCYLPLGPFNQTEGTLEAAGLSLTMCALAQKLSDILNLHHVI